MSKTTVSDEPDESGHEEEVEVSTLFDEIQRAIEPYNPAADGYDLQAADGTGRFAQFTLRVPQSVQQELHEMADDLEMSVALLVNCLIDAYLINQTGRGYSDLASWYLPKVLRRPKSRH